MNGGTETKTKRIKGIYSLHKVYNFPGIWDLTVVKIRDKQSGDIDAPPVQRSAEPTITAIYPRRTSVDTDVLDRGLMTSGSNPGQVNG